MFLRQSPSADLSDTGSFVQTPEKPINRKDTNILPIRGNNRSSNRMMGPEIDEQSPQLLPYQHRKKLSQKEELMKADDAVQHNNIMIEQPPPMDQSPGVGESSKRPPLPGANNRGVGGIEQQQLGANAPPPPPMPMQNTMSSPPPSASKYKVAVIPPFRGGGLEGQSHERSSSMDDESIEQKQRQGGSGGKMKKMRKVKSAQSSSSSSRKNRKNKRGNNNNGGNNNNPNQSSKATTPDNNGDKFRPPRHEVIDPTPPPPLPQSPRQGGYHVRVSSQSSISSLESKAATDAEGQQQQQQQQIPHPNTSEYWYYQQKQLQQQYNARQTQQQKQPRGVPNAAGGNFNVNFNAVLGPEVASFLHGEEIASAVERRQQGMPHPNSQQYGGPPPPQQQWNDPRQQYGGQQQWVQGQHPGVYGQSLEGHLIPNNHPLPPQQQPHGYPGYHPEPQAPPLTYQHPNMHFDKRQHRERLPSVSEDDFDEMLEADKRNREGDRSRQQPQHQQQWNQQQQYSRQYNNPQQQQWNQQQYPPRQQQGHERKHSRKGSRRQRSRGGSNGGGGFLGNDGPPPNEKSSLLSATGIQTYESRDGRGGGGGKDYNVNNNPGVWGGQQQRHPQAYNTPREQMTNASRGGGGATNSSKKKKSKRRRREKEKRRFAYPSDSSDEETSGNRRSTTKSKRRGGGGGRRSQRKKRSQAASGGGTPSIDHSSMSETYSESFMSTSYADRSERVRAKGPLQQLLISSKLLICNLPLSSAAISFSIVLLGIVWLKWTEEILPSCKEANFHSSQCTYPEFPGCYFCDEYNPYYRLATQFHTVCSLTAGISVLLFFVKAILCWRVFMDEMSSPTTASPSGLIFMTMALGFVGKDWGDLGMILVFIASLLHLVLVVWFIYMSLAYQTMPDPSWFANTIGIGLCAVKIWFYYPLSGHFLIAITLMLTFLYYPIR